MPQGNGVSIAVLERGAVKRRWSLNLQTGNRWRYDRRAVR